MSDMWKRVIIKNTYGPQAYLPPLLLALLVLAASFMVCLSRRGHFVDHLLSCKELFQLLLVLF